MVTYAYALAIDHIQQLLEAKSNRVAVKHPTARLIIGFIDLSE